MSGKAEDERWLRDCGWCGWLVDVNTGKVVTHAGEHWPNLTALRLWLESLPKWPRAVNGCRNVPSRGHAPT